ncbi:MAG: hypothetical protein JNJ98_05170 [Gemmatimonadetes bacterium]|nr:hypothetical protein [Gemmatimonadota bacterium]
MRAERPYTPEEEQAVRQARAATGTAECPRCALPMREKAIGGGSFGLGYARRRTWLLCPSCRNSVIFDAERGTRT